MSNLRICLDARLTSEAAGGVTQFVIGLAYGLSQLKDGAEEYCFLAYPDADEWLKPYLAGNCRILYGPAAPKQMRWKQTLTRFAPVLRNAWHVVATHGVNLPVSDGTIERAGIDLMHFTYQWAFLTNVPSIYHPHDLQHLHLPELFTPRVRVHREAAFRTFCTHASLVAVASTWGKNDLIEQYKLPKEKVQVVPLAPAIAAYPTPTQMEIEAVHDRYALPDNYVFYPAQTWPHKNHIGLLEALAILRDERQLVVPFVSSGHLYEYFQPQVEQQVRRLGLTDQVRFLGFVSPLELQALYRLCRCVIIPTRFEAASFPLWEAFIASAPAACSDVTSLPDQAGDAALIFNPNDPREIANSIYRLWTDNSLCQTLVEHGQKRVAQFSWERTARLFRAHYRRILGSSLTHHDEELLSSSPLL